MNGLFKDKVFVALVSSWLTITTFTQHPNRSYDRLRVLDRYTLVIPNWRFFAPNPATHDFIFGVRWRMHGDNKPTDWYMINSFYERRLTHMFYYPNRRIEKSLSDVAGRVLANLSSQPELLEKSPDYQLLLRRAHKFVEENAGSNVEKYQFMLAADTGYEEGNDLKEFFVSPGIQFSKV